MAAVRQKVVLFGGTQYRAGNPIPPSLGDTWEWDGTSWLEKSPPSFPPARQRHAMASVGERVVLFGGDSFVEWDWSQNPTPQILGDTWEWDGAGWTERNPATSPSPRSGHAMATLGGKVVLFGGWAASGELGDTWEWNGTTWSEVTPANSPPAQAGHAMATLGSRLVLYGRGETWEWDGTTWTEKTPATRAPEYEWGCAVAALNGTAVLFGGWHFQGPAAETWEWDGTSWNEQPSPRVPPARSTHAMATLGAKVVLFGGVDEWKVVLGDTWVMEAFPSAD
jgi:hypothetical protein